MLHIVFEGKNIRLRITQSHELDFVVLIINKSDKKKKINDCKFKMYSYVENSLINISNT